MDIFAVHTREFKLDDRVDIFAAVNAANAKLSRQTGSRCWISISGVFLCSGALASLIGYTVQHNPAHVWVMAVMLGLAFVIVTACAVAALFL